MYVGNLAAARDFLDVRDAVEAYLTLARRGEGAQIYNVCSGRAVTMRDVLRESILIAGVAVEVREDPARMRARETTLSVGNPREDPRCNRLAGTYSLKTIVGGHLRACARSSLKIVVCC